MIKHIKHWFKNTFTTDCLIAKFIPIPIIQLIALLVYLVNY